MQNTISWRYKQHNYNCKSTKVTSYFHLFYTFKPTLIKFNFEHFLPVDVMCDVTCKAVIMLITGVFVSFQHSSFTVTTNFLSKHIYV